MRSMYAMRRANGDWYAVENKAGLHVPVFHSSDDAARARMRNWRMLLFSPVVLDERAVKDLATREGETAVDFWLVDDPGAKLERGRAVDHGQLALFIYGVGEEHGPIAGAGR